MNSRAPLYYKVGEAARLTGVSASTLRAWEDQGLVVPVRSETGHRQYTIEHLAQLKRIQWYRSERGLNPAAIREALEAEGGLNSPDTEIEHERDKSADIGRKLRSLRHSSGKTLEQVAKAIGISTSVLSTFERTSSGLTFRGLHNLAHYYNTTVPKLSGECAEESLSVVKAGQWKHWPGTAPGITVQTLANGHNMMDCHRFVLAPGASSEGAYEHKGEEFLHVISGYLEVVLDGREVYELETGDSLYFQSRRLHAWRNRHDRETIILWVNTAPTF